MRNLKKHQKVLPKNRVGWKNNPVHKQRMQKLLFYPEQRRVPRAPLKLPKFLGKNSVIGGCHTSVYRRYGFVAGKAEKRSFPECSHRLPFIRCSQGVSAVFNKNKVVFSAHFFNFIQVSRDAKCVLYYHRL